MTAALTAIAFRYGEQDNVRVPKLNAITSYVQSASEITDDPTIIAFAGLTGTVDTVPYFTGDDTMALTGFTATARSLLDDTSTSAMRTTLGLAIGTNVQAWDATLDDLASRNIGAASSTDIIDRAAGDGRYILSGAGVTDGDKGDIVVTGGGLIWTFDSSVVTSAGRALLDDADAAAQRTTLGITATGSDTTYLYRANNLSDVASASTSRTNLGLGTMAVQNANAVAITGGTATTLSSVSIVGLPAQVALTITDGAGAYGIDTGSIRIGGGAVTIDSSSAQFGTVVCGNLTATGNVNLGDNAADTITLTGTTTITRTGSATVPTLTLAGSSRRWVDFGATGTGVPAFTTRSAGTKLVLYNSIDGSDTDIAIGVDSSSVMNLQVPTTSGSINIYGGTTLAATITGAGVATFVSTVAGTNITSGGDTTGNAATATKWATARTIGITGDAIWSSGSLDGSANVTAGITFATVNSNVGSFGSATKSVTATVNAKGLVTAISEATITPAASSITGAAALTKTDDTNVTLTLGGSPTTALLAAASLTLGWTGTLAVARGGTGSGTAAGARTALGLAIGSDVQAYDADLTTWAGITPAANIGTFLATPSSANLIAAVTDETGSGALVFGTSPTLTTPVLNGVPTGSVASAATASTLVSRDANGNTAANNFVEGFTTTATAAGTTTLTIAATYTQVFTGTTTQTVKLPTTSVLQGQQYLIINQSTGAVTVQSSGANTIVILAAGTSAFFTAVVATPTTAANWSAQYAGANVASGKVATINNSLTLAGTDGTTMTFPVTDAQIARIDAAQTFAGTQTFGAAISATATGSSIVFRGTSGGAASTTGLRLLDTDDSNTLRVVCGGDLTANRTLRIDTADNNRILTFSADATIGGTNTGDQTISLTGDVVGSGTGSFATTVGKINGVSLAALSTGILKNTTATGAPSIAVAGDFPTLNQNTSGSAATLTTARAIYGNNFDGSAALTQIVASTYGGTGNGFTKFTGPATAERTFALPNADATILYSGGAGGTPSSLTLTNATSLPISGLTASTSTAIGVGSIELGHATDTSITRVSAGVAAIEGANIIVSGGALGTPSSGTLTNCTFPTLNQNTTGSAAKLTTARTIAGNSFDGTANISINDTDLSGAAWTSYTPTVTANVGAFTTVSATGYYKKIGKTVFVQITVTITLNGTASNSFNVTAPFASANVGATVKYAFAAVESGVAGNSGYGLLGNNTSNILVALTTGGYFGGTGYIIDIGGCYQAA